MNKQFNELLVMLQDLSAELIISINNVRERPDQKRHIEQLTKTMGDMHAVTLFLMANDHIDACLMNDFAAVKAEYIKRDTTVFEGKKVI